MSTLVLSLFPGIGLLDQAFEEHDWCVVRGPDLLWGGDVHRFHPPADVFAGVIGGPPCQRFSRLRRIFGHRQPEAPDLIPEFARCVAEARPRWWLMENVPDAPVPRVRGYTARTYLLADHWCGGATRRLRRFVFGTPEGAALRIETLALHDPEPLPAVCASGSTWVPAPEGGRSKPSTKRGHISGVTSNAFFRDAVRATGLPEGWDLPGWTVKAKIRAIGNAVPLAMGRAVAAAVTHAVDPDREVAA
jgi:DNA (cytosine-5)-methyltransferase 1